jgi:hypothetical protein
MLRANRQTNSQPYPFFPASGGPQGGIYIHRDDDVSLYHELGRPKEMVSVQHRPHHEDIWRRTASDARGYISGYISDQHAMCHCSCDYLPVIGALDAPEYASFVSHNHQDGQVGSLRDGLP